MHTLSSLKVGYRVTVRR